MLRWAICFAECCVQRNDGQHFVFTGQLGGSILHSILCREVCLVACCVGPGDGQHDVLGSQSASMSHIIFCRAACFVGPDDGQHVVLGGQSVSMLHSILVWVVRWTTCRVEAHDRWYAALGSLFRSMLC